MPPDARRGGDRGGPWIPSSTSYPERRPGWHGPSQQDLSTRQAPRDWAPRDQNLPDITALVPGNSGVVCEACGVGGHFIKECPWITRQLLPEIRAHLASWMQAHAKGEDYFKRACSLIRKHGFMGSWSEEDYRRFPLDIAHRAKRHAEDPNRSTYESQKNRYGSEKSPPVVGRYVDNRPAWSTNPSPGGR